MTPLRSISLALLVLFPVLELFCYALLWRRNDHAIRKRNKLMMCIASLAGWLAFVNLILSLFGGLPCIIFHLVSLLIAPMSVGPQLVRALTLRGTLRHSQLIIEDDIISSRDHNGRRTSRSSDTSEKKIEANLVMMKMQLMVKVTIAALIAVPTLVLVVAFAITSESGNINMLETDLDHCSSEPAFAFLTPAFGIASTALALLATMLIRNAQDELGLRREILRNVIFLGCTYIAILTIRLLGYNYEWQSLLQTIQQMFLSFSMIIIPCLSAFEFVPPSDSKQTNHASPVMSTASSTTLPGYAQPIPRPRSTRPSMIGGRISIVTPIKQEQRAREVTVSWDAGLCILLSTQEGINVFLSHCAREFSSENVRFWVAVNEYKAKFDEESFRPSSETDTDDEAEAESNDGDAAGGKGISETDICTLASSIYASFVEDTDHQVNLSSKHKSDIKKAIESKQLTKYTFDAAQKEIFGVMARDSYPRYLASTKRKKNPSVI